MGFTLFSSGVLDTLPRTIAWLGLRPQPDPIRVELNIPGKMARGIIGGNIREILRGPFLLYRAVLSGTTGRPGPPTTERPPTDPAHQYGRPTRHPAEKSGVSDGTGRDRIAERVPSGSAV